MNSPARGPVRVQLLYVPDCPLVGRLRNTLDDCLRHVGFAVRVEELEGSYPSPTLVIDGIDVVTGTPPSREICCRLDLPTCAQINTALNRAARHPGFSTRACGSPATISRGPGPRF